MSPLLSAADTDIEIDTIIIGNGPSAMILSYILHGHIPVYVSNPPHPDPLLHAKLREAPCLLRPDIDALTHHFAASRLSYSTQALPVNVLLDTLLRPEGETDGLVDTTHVEWQYRSDHAIPHLVLGNAPQPGGLWADDPVRVSWDIQTLSYAGMLSLPGYTFADYYRKAKGLELPPFTRPTRRELAEYLRVYPAEAGINDAFRSNVELQGIERTSDGFYIRSHGIRCSHLVLATGIFSHAIQPPPLLAPLTSLPAKPSAPLLVIGSGFTAADTIISARNDQPILHIFRWDPDHRPSPLKACHQQAYPEYAGIYRLMKRAALSGASSTQQPKARRLASTSFLESRNWDAIYEGLPNAEVQDMQIHDGKYTVTFRLPDGNSISRAVTELAYGVGRRGSLHYLDPVLRSEILKDAGDPLGEDAMVSGKTLRNKVMEDLEVARNVFVIGSLTGDSLIRFAYGGCVYAASRLILGGKDRDESASSTPKRPVGTPTGGREAQMNGVDGHAHHLHFPHTNGREILRQSLDRRKSVDEHDFDDDMGSRSPIGPRISNWWTAFVRLLF